MFLLSQLLDDSVLPIFSPLRDANKSTLAHVFLTSCVLAIAIANVGAYLRIIYIHYHIPGPFLARLTRLYLYSITYLGVEASTLDALHQQYGPIIIIAPNEVSVSDGRVLKSVYTDGGGYRKAPCYRNFDIDGHASIFSELVKEKRAKRWRAVQGLFSTGTIGRDGEEGVKVCVRLLAELWEEGKRRAENNKEKKIDLLAGARAFALDAVTGYLFGRRYGALDELRVQNEKGEMSAGSFVDTFVAVGRFFYLPTWAFGWVELLAAKMAKDKKVVETSMLNVDEFVSSLVEDAEKKIEDVSTEKEGNSYQARLLKAGISISETKAQCKDLMFAGTDSTGMNLATLCWNLTKHPETYKKLRLELEGDPSASPFALPWLNACIKEALRLSMANPTRMPRVVPSVGLQMPSPSNLFIPPDTIVGLQPYSLHHNPEVFPSPKAFVPERWENATPEMLRDWIPFGLGSRACIARNLAMVELVLACEGIVKSGVLDGLRGCGEAVDILEWFNSRVVEGRIEVEA